MFDFMVEKALVNLLAAWINAQDDEGQDPETHPAIVYRLGWLIDRGVGNYGNIASITIAELLMDEAKKQGYVPPPELLRVQKEDLED